MTTQLFHFRWSTTEPPRLHAYDVDPDGRMLDQSTFDGRCGDIPRVYACLLKGEEIYSRSTALFHDTPPLELMGQLGLMLNQEQKTIDLWTSDKALAERMPELVSFLSALFEERGYARAREQFVAASKKAVEARDELDRLLGIKS